MMVLIMGVLLASLLFLAALLRYWKQLVIDRWLKCSLLLVLLILMTGLGYLTIFLLMLGRNSP